MKKIVSILFSTLLLFQVQAQMVKTTKTLIDSKEQPPSDFKKQSMISMSVSDLVFTNISIKYNYFKKDGKTSFEIPLSLNAGGVPDTANYKVTNAGRFLSARNRIFQTGFNLNYYLEGQDIISPFVGFSMAAGWFYYWKYDYSSSPTPPYYSTFTNEKLIATNTSFAFHAGVLYNPWETLTFTAKAGAGLRRYTTIYQEYTYPFAILDFSVGFKF